MASEVPNMPRRATWLDMPTTAADVRSTAIDAPVATMKTRAEYSSTVRAAYRHASS